MRSDSTMPQETFRRSADWQFDPLAGDVRPDIDRRYETGHVQGEHGRRWHSFSGHERNHLFMNREGKSFHDESALSGLDNIADGRSFARFDFDRDGWEDIALVNANYPLLNVYRNELGNTSTSRDNGNFIAVRLVGGNRSSGPSIEFSNRDGIGAEIRVSFGGRSIRREVRCGEGFAAQNSNTHLIGIGSHHQATDLSIHWPAGKISQLGAVTAGQLITVFENSTESGIARGCRVEEYRTPPVEFDRAAPVIRPVVQLPLRSGSHPAKLHLITTMATWCEACKQHLPQIEHLRETFPEDQLAMIGVPADPIDTQEALAEYVNQYKPAYHLATVSPDELSSIVTALKKTIRSDALPATLVTDSNGNVLQAFEGVPSASAIARLFEM